MATYSSHRLTMGKVEIESFCCLTGDIRFFHRYVYLVVLVHVSYDFCPNCLITLVDGVSQRVNFRKILKILLLRNRKEDEAETWHTCIGHRPLQKICFYSCRIRTLVAMATYSFDRLIIGRVENISTVSLGLLEFYFYRNAY